MLVASDGRRKVVVLPLVRALDPSECEFEASPSALPAAAEAKLEENVEGIFASDSVWVECLGVEVD